MGGGSTKMRFLRRGTKRQHRTSRSNSFPVGSIKENENNKPNVQRVIMTNGQVNVKPSLENDDTPEKPTEISLTGEIHLSSGCASNNLISAQESSNMRNRKDSTPSTPPPSARKQSEIKLAKFSDKMTASELYNLLVGETWQGLPQIHDTAYMLLLDCRGRSSFEKLHIITARHHSAVYSEYGLLLPSQIRLFHLVILYGHSAPSDDLSNFSKKLSEDEIEHYVLETGATGFFSEYPFLSTENHFLTSDVRSTLQTMPSEILPGLLYQGNGKHALDPYIIASLGITHIVNVTLEHPNKFEDTVQYLRIQLDDRPHIDLLSWLPKTSAFIESAIGDRLNDRRRSSNVEHKTSRGAVLVHCNLGRSRSSTVVLGYLMQVRGMSLGEASRLLKDARPSVRPNIGFLEQLLRYEKEIFGECKTELNDLPF